MRMGVFYLATSVYMQYFDKYFFKTMHNIFPEDEKEVIILTDKIPEEYNNCKIKNCNLHFEKIIDFPYPIINLCKFQIIDEYAKKYNIDIVLFFDADTVVFKKDMEFWNSLKKKCLDNKNTLIMSRHPYYVYEEHRDFTAEFYFPYRDNSCSNVTEEQLKIVREQSTYIIASFFMGYKDALSDYAKKVHVMTHNNLVNLHWMPYLPEENYINVINLRENLSIDLDSYITMNLRQSSSVWETDVPEKQSVFIRQKFDDSIKNAKKYQI